jgi:RHS repeat-associated protein
LQTGLILGNLALISGADKTPQDVFLSGWDSMGVGSSPLPVHQVVAVSRPEPHVPNTLPRDGGSLLLGLAPGNPAARGTDSPTAQAQAVEQPRTSDAGWLDDWLAAVDAALARKPSAPSAASSAPDSNTPPNSGGGNAGPAGGGAPLTAGAAGATGRGGGEAVDLSSASLMTSGQASATSSMATQAPASQAAPAPTSTGSGPTASQAPAGSTVAASGNPVPSQPSGEQPAGRANLASSFGQVPLSFEVNAGQAGDPSVRFLSHGPGFSLWSTGDSLVFATPHNDPQSGQTTGRDVFRMQFVGANPDAEVVGLDQLPSRSNYFIGNDPTNWHTDVPQYGQVQYQNLYPGIDLVLRSHSATDRSFEYDFVVHPGADPSAIHMQWQGLAGLGTDSQGHLLLQTSGGTVVQDAPVLIQNSGATQKNVAGSVVLLGNNETGFHVTGSYDTSQDLVIDPQVNFASYLGGSSDDKGYSIAVDSSGDSYVSGTTQSSNFPTVNGFTVSGNAGTYAFISKVSPDGTGLVYSTYLGGTSTTSSTAVAVDLGGSAYVAGYTSSIDLVTTPGAYNTSNTSATSFVTKLNASGDALSYSTYFGADSTVINAIAVDQNGVAYLTGQTGAGIMLAFPTTTGALQTTTTSINTAFVSVLNSAGSTLVYSTFLGGSTADDGTGIAVNTSGNAYVTGWTQSSNFPTAHAMQGSLAGTQNAFVSELNSAGTSLVYSTYLGGNGTDAANAIALGYDGKVYVAGATNSSNFPTVSGAYQTSLNGLLNNVFVSALNAAGSTLTLSTYLGGTGGDTAYGIAVDSLGQPTVVGSTGSSNFPTYHAFQASSGGGTDAFIARLTTTGTLSYSSYYGGSGTDEARAVAVDARGDAYMTGDTNSTNLPGTAGNYQGSNGGGYDAFAAKVLTRPNAPKITAISPNTGLISSDNITSSRNLHISGTSDPNVTVTLERADLGVLGSVLANANGTWSYDYSGTTLSDSDYNFIGVASDSGGVLSDPSQTLPITVDNTAPTVTVSAVPTTSLAPTVSVQVSDPVGVPAGATVTLNVDLNNDGNFTDPNETGYASGTVNSSGVATIVLPQLSAVATYALQGQFTGPSGLTGTSATSTATITSTAGGTWTPTAQVLSVDPDMSTFTPVLGDVSFDQVIDIGQSPQESCGCFSADLVYHSSETTVKPFVQVSIPTDNTHSSLPGSISAALTFNGVTGPTMTYSTSGFHPGDILTLALQSPTTITSTGRYNYSVTEQPTGMTAQTVSGTAFAVSEDSSSLGAGVSIAGLDQLVPIAASGGNPAGMLRVYGSGGYRFYQGTSTFSSMAGDNGTLTVSGSTYTYTTPDGMTWTFVTSGTNAYLTQWTSADGQETRQYRYDGSHRLSGITTSDGAVSTFSYSAGSVVVQAINSRTTTLTLDGSNNLTAINNPDGGLRTFTYDSSHHLTREQFGLVENNWAYTTAGVLGTYTWGAVSVGGVTNLSRTTVAPVATQGLNSLVANTVYGSSTNPDGNTSKLNVDSRGRPLISVDPLGDTTTDSYSNGFLSSETDPLGRSTNYNLDSSGYVTQQTNADGTSITYSYQSAFTGFHALTQKTDELGHNTTYAYDSSGHMTSSTDALGKHTTYTYSNGLLQSVTGPLGHTTTTLYDGDRRPTVTIDALGNRTTYSYDANGNQQTVTDALGHTSTTLYDVMQRPTVTIDAAGNRTTTTYDVSGMALTTTDALGMQTSLIYDGYNRGLLSQSIDGAGSLLPAVELNNYDAAGLMTSSRDAAGAWTFTGYDQDGRQYFTADARGDAPATRYDKAGEVIVTGLQVRQGQTGLGTPEYPTHYSYDLRGQQTQVKDDLGNITTTAYDAAGNVTATTDALGRTLTYSYDVLDRQTGTLDALGRRTTTTFDAVGNVLTQTDHLGNTTSYAYDAVNRQTMTTEAVGTSVQRTTQQSYDAVGNVTTSTDALNNVSTSVYDNLNRQTVAIDPLGHRVTTTYDALGNVLTTTDPLGKVVTDVYDSLHRQIATTDPLGHTTTTVLDAVGNVMATIDPLGHISKNLLDAAERHVGSVDALGRVTTISLYANMQLHGGAMWAITDPDGNTTQYLRDGLFREIKSIDPTGAVTTTSYDAVGNVTQVVDRDGRTINYSFDSVNRESGEVWKSAAGATVNVVTYGYDVNDNRTSAADSSGTLTYTYDALNRVKTDTNVFGQVLTYSYDANDHVTLRTDSLGGTLTSVYDNAGRLTSKQLTSTGAAGAAVRVDFGYNNRDEMTSKTWYSNIAGSSVVATSTYAIDDAGRVTSIVDKNSTATTLSYYNYGYDAADRVTTQTYWSKIGTVTYSGTLAYSYDPTNQLTSDGTSNYSFDANGNRTMTGYSTGADNRMSSDGTYTYYYDNAGNTIEKTRGSGQETWYYGWDNRNRLSSVRKTSDGTTNTLTVTYTYDVDDRLVQQAKWVSGGSTVTTRYAYDGENVWADLDGSNNLLVRYVFGDGSDQVLTRTEASGQSNPGVAEYFTDRLGSVRDLANSSAVVQDHIDYGGFGSVTEAAAVYGDRIKFTARWFDPDTGLQNNRARWYQVSTGRWMSEDPMGFGAGDVNLDRYVGNNATNATDPSGLTLKVGGKVVTRDSDLYDKVVSTRGFNKGEDATAKEILNAMIDSKVENKTYTFKEAADLQKEVELRLMVIRAAREIAPQLRKRIRFNSAGEWCQLDQATTNWRERKDVQS